MLSSRLKRICQDQTPDSSRDMDRIYRNVCLLMHHYALGKGVSLANDFSCLRNQIFLES